MSNRLFIGNLSHSVTEKDIRKEFSEFGEVTDVHMPTDSSTGKFRGFAFITMRTEADANAAIAATSKKQITLNGRYAVVRSAPVHHQDAGGLAGQAGTSERMIWVGGGTPEQEDESEEPLKQETKEGELFAVLRVHGEGDLPLATVATFLLAVDSIHRCFDALDVLSSLADTALLLREGNFTDAFKVAQQKVTPPVLSAVEFHSPGWWEIFGHFSPLEFIRSVIKDHREHKKDDAYRNREEAKQLELNNILLNYQAEAMRIENDRKADEARLFRLLKENDVVEGRLAILKKAGVSDKEIQKAITPMIRATCDLSELTREGVIGKSTIQLSPPSGKRIQH